MTLLATAGSIGVQSSQAGLASAQLSVRQARQAGRQAGLAPASCQALAQRWCELSIASSAGQLGARSAMPAGLIVQCMAVVARLPSMAPGFLRCIALRCLSATVYSMSPLAAGACGRQLQAFSCIADSWCSVGLAPFRPGALPGDGCECRNSSPSHHVWVCLHTLLDSRTVFRSEL